MRDISAVLIGLLPALILWGLGEAERTAPEFFYAAAAAVAVSLAVYHLLRRWRHPSLLVLLTLGAPCCFTCMWRRNTPSSCFFSTEGASSLFWAVLGAVIAGAWSWSGVGGNIAYFCTALLSSSDWPGEIGVCRGGLADGRSLWHHPPMPGRLLQLDLSGRPAGFTGVWKNCGIDRAFFDREQGHGLAFLFLMLPVKN